MNRPPRTDQRGIALLLVLWIFMVLGVIALDFSHYIRDEAMASVNFSDETRGYYVALAGMNRALFDAIQERSANPGQNPGAPGGVPRKSPDGVGKDDEEQIPADGVWHPGDFSGARYEVRMSDEEGLIPININFANPEYHGQELLNAVMTYLVQGGDATKGQDRRAKADIDGLVGAITDYEDCDHIGNAERGAKNAWFDAPDELLQIPGMTADLFYGSGGMPGLRDLVTVYGSRKPRINTRTVTAPVLQVLLRIDATAAEDLINERDADGDDVFLTRVQGMAGTVGPFADVFEQLAPHTIRVEARADISEERNRSWVGAIVELEAGNAEGPRVRRWLDRTWDGRLPSPPDVSGPLS